MGCVPVKNSTVIMWVFSAVIVLGILMTIANLECRYVFSKYDGLILTIIGFFASMITAIKTGEPITVMYGSSK